MVKIIKYTQEDLEWIFSLLPGSFESIRRRSLMGQKKLRKVLARLHKDKKIMYNKTDKIIEPRKEARWT